ncbi:MAG: hypothetical protein WCK89_15530 [bacterium]
MSATRIIDVVDAEAFGFVPPCADERFDHRTCDYWEDADRGSRARRESWLRPQGQPSAGSGPRPRVDPFGIDPDQAAADIARELWNKYYAPVFKQRDCILPGVYSHMINNVLYIPDYPMGHLMAFQIEEQMKKAGKIGPEFERITKMGNVTPDLWMKHATGATVGADAMLHATRLALGEVTK